MNICEPAIRRPVATTLLTMGLAALGMLAFTELPVASLPSVDFPTISVQASMPGASPDVMASSVAAPLERHLGQIAAVTEMTSQSSVGSARITLQFDVDRNIDGAARDVEAAINAARADLPTALHSNPTYRKFNPADSPVMVLTLTSDTFSRGQLYDSASTVLLQKLSQIEGIGNVDIGGASLPAVRVELQPQALFKYGIGLEDVRAALASANADSPKGAIEQNGTHFQIYTNDQARTADQYRPLVIAYRKGAAVQLKDVAEIDDSVEDLRNEGVADGQPAVILQVFKTPGANVIDTVKRVRALLPELEAAIPANIHVSVAVDRTPTIQASLTETEVTLIFSALLVVLVVFLFLGDPRATAIPAVAVPVSIFGTFAAMYALGYTLDNFSLMALTVSTGFVVDDAIVVLENVKRHMEAGMPRYRAAIKGAGEVGFTVLSMSLSLIAVFAPILLMGGLLGRMFREFAVTLAIAVLVSLVISLTTTPMMCARLLTPPDAAPRAASPGRLRRLARWASDGTERVYIGLLAFYRRTLAVALRFPLLVILTLFIVFGFNFFLYGAIPKGFFPQQDSGLLMGSIQADQSISFQSMEKKLRQLIAIVKADPAVASVVGFTGGRATNSGFVFTSLKPESERDATSDEVVARLRPRLAKVAGATLFFQSAQDVRVGGRQGNAQYQYTLQGEDAQELSAWMPRLVAALAKEPALTDVNSDQQQKGLETDLVIDRITARRLGLQPNQIDNTLYDAFGQRQVSTIYNALNQYHVIMEVAPRYWQNPASLKDIYISTSGGSASGTQSSGAVAGTVGSAASSLNAASIAGDSARNQALNSIASTGHSSASSGAAVSTSLETMVPLSAVASYRPGNTPLSINHQGQFVAATLSFNLKPGKSLSDAVSAIARASDAIEMPADIHGGFAGTAAVFQSSLAQEGWLVLAALGAVYIVLGILYESYIHPVTILSTLPSAGVGALLALMLCGIDFSIMALIGIVLLIGIVKKNAIMMVDFAIDAERSRNLSPEQAIFEACMMRFRPILMTTLAALLGALPLAIGFGEGSELRRPLGISIIGGLLVSQILTLYTTPVVYLYLDRLRSWGASRPWRGRQPLPESQL